MKKWITLTTDFTQHDGYVGVMKGVIAGIAPQAGVIDLCHDIAPQNVFQGALLLGRSVPYFPPGTVHVAVVDPGVGTARRGIAAQLGEQYFVGPDNGLITFLLQACKKKEPGLSQRAIAAPLMYPNEKEKLFEIYALENPEYQLPDVSHTFHGRDIFAPAGAYLAAGEALENFGAVVHDPVLLDVAAPQKTEQGLQGEIIQVDAFGNLASNIRAEHLNEYLAKFKNIHIILKHINIEGISTTFGKGSPGELIAVIDSFGFLGICVVNGSAAVRTGAGLGDKLQVTCS